MIGQFIKNYLPFANLPLMKLLRNSTFVGVLNICGKIIGEFGSNEGGGAEV